MDQLYHYGVKGMKWGVRKDEYKSASRSRKKEIRKEYYKTPEGRLKKAATLGTMFGGPLGGIIAGSIANKRMSSVDKTTIEKGKKKVKDLPTDNKVETDEQKINRLIAEGKTNPKTQYVFDQNGNLMMAYWDD